MNTAPPSTISQIHTAAEALLQDAEDASGMSSQQFNGLSEVVDAYIELGMPDEAARLIDSLSPDLQDCEEILALRLLVLAEQGDYLKASAVAKELCVHRPEQSTLIETVAICLLRGDDLAGAIHWMAGHKEHFPRFMAWPLNEAKAQPPFAAATDPVC